MPIRVEVCLHNIKHERMKIIDQYKFPACINNHGSRADDTQKKYNRIPIGSRTASFNFALYEILRAYHKSNSGISLLIYR